jgi:hypothetical protein
MGKNYVKQFFVNTLVEEPHTKWRCGTTAPMNNSSRAAGRNFAEDHDLHQGFFMNFDFHVGTSKFNVKIYDCTQCQKEYKADV